MPHTWIIDIDGTVLVHNGYLIGQDILLPGVREFWGKIPAKDTIVLMTARSQDLAAPTLEFLQLCGIRFDYAIFGVGVGERILINDKKPRGLETALAVNLTRDSGFEDLEVMIQSDKDASIK